MRVGVAVGAGQWDTCRPCTDLGHMRRHRPCTCRERSADSVHLERQGVAKHAYAQAEAAPVCVKCSQSVPTLAHDHGHAAVTRIEAYACVDLHSTALGHEALASTAHRSKVRCAHSAVDGDASRGKVSYTAGVIVAAWYGRARAVDVDSGA